MEDSLNQEVDRIIEDIEFWTGICAWLEDTSLQFYNMFGMTTMTRRLIGSHYQVKIKALELALREMERLKNMTIESSTDPNIIERYAKYQLEHERIKENYDHYLATDQIRE
jgi:hypothetical protein